LISAAAAQRGERARTRGEHRHRRELGGACEHGGRGIGEEGTPSCVPVAPMTSPNGAMFRATGTVSRAAPVPVGASVVRRGSVPRHRWIVRTRAIRWSAACRYLSFPIGPSIEKDRYMGEWYSLEEVADRLGLHVRTVRKYVREGRLGAVRIGKQYRVSPADLEALTGGPARPRRVVVTSVVDVDGIGAADAQRLSDFLAGLPRPDGAPHVDVVHEPDHDRLKVIVVGSAEASVELVRLLAARAQEAA
jgi:excisionase family DNA binding protein